MMVSHTRLLPKTTERLISSSWNSLKKRKTLKSSGTLLLKQSLDFSSRNLPMRVPSTSRWDKKPERGFYRIKQVKYSRKKIWSTYGICWKSICRSLMTELNVSTTTNLCSCPLVFRPSVANFSAPARSSSSSAMSSVVLRLSPSSIML